MTHIHLNFWGTRGSCPGFDNKSLYYGGNTTCVSIDIGNELTLILDAGTGITKCGQTLMDTSKDIVLILTHLHWDHIQGLPFFSPIYLPRELFFYSALPHDPLAYCCNQMDGVGHPLKMSLLPSTFTTLSHSEIQKKYPVKISHIRTRHPGHCYAYKIECNNVSIVFMPDNQLHHNPSGLEISNIDLKRFCENADILIHDAQYNYHDMPLKKEWGHSVFEETVQFAINANVKKLFLFHHDPQRSDSEIDYFVKRSADIVEQSNSKLEVFAAYDGLSLLA